MGRRIRENDEFLLAELLDGHLPADQAADLRQRMERQPELRAAFKSLADVHALLARRQADQPRVDWRGFHKRVMDAVEAEPVAPPRRSQLARWLRIGAPLAAAAAIALLVSRYPAGPETGGPEAASSAGPVAAVAPSGDVGQVLVRFERPPLDSAGQTGVVQVSFARSAQLAEAIQQEDKANRSRPPTVFAAVPPPSLPDGALRAFLEAPPL